MTTLRYRLMIEGWPEEFVTDPTITDAGNTDGRVVLSGLSYKGLRFQERVIPLEAKIQASGMTFRLVPTYTRTLSRLRSTDPMTASLSNVPAAEIMLLGDLDETSTTMPAVSSGTLADGVYHLGTEAIRVNTYPTIERNVWQTLPQTHNRNGRSLFITTRPVTMEGRRCYLFEYSDDDAPTGNGTIVWRGIIGNPPRLDRDGSAWILQAQPITYLLNQTIGGGFEEAHPAAIYFNWRQAFYCRLYYGTNPGTGDEFEFQFTGLYTEASLIAAVNQAFSTNLVIVGSASSHFANVKLEYTTNGWSVVVQKTTVDDEFLGIVIGSYATGFASTAGGATRSTTDHWQYDSKIILPPMIEMGLVGQYRIYLTPLADFEYDGTAGAIGSGGNEQQHKASAQASHPENRIYIDQDFSNATSINIDGIIRDVPITGPGGAVFARGAHINTIIGSGTTTIDGTAYSYIDIDSTTNESYLLNGETKIEVLRNYTTEGSVIEFIDSVVAQSIHANDGDTPFLTYADISEALEIAGDALGTDILRRKYAFTKQLALGDILSRELQLCAHFLRLGADGRMEFAPIVVPTYGAHTDNIGVSDILTPDGPTGSWPLVEPQRDGAVVSVSVQQRYDALTDEWVDKPITIVDGDSIGTHKNRGRGKVEIKTYSSPVLEPEYTFIAKIAERFMGFGSREYIMITAEVPRRLRGVLCGDIVALTYQYIPDGDGFRGVTDAPCMVIERKQELDPAVTDRVTLVLWMLAKRVGGYCPSALVTSQANTAGDTWTIGVDDANPVNIDLSVSGNGDVASSFNTGDRVRITEILNETPTTVDGTVISSGSNVITVTFDTTWTPSSLPWVLLYINDADATSTQLRQVFVADASLATPAGMRRFI